MSVSIWAWLPEVCDGDVCVGDCDLCSKAQDNIALMEGDGDKMDDTIYRREAIDALWKALYEYEDKTEKQFIESEELDIGDWFLHRIFVQNMSDIDRQTILKLPSAQPEPSQVARDIATIIENEKDMRVIRSALDESNTHNTLEALEQRWIPCSERLPDIKEHHVSDPCIVYCENGAYGFAELEENMFGQVGWNCERDDDYHEPLGEVVAWMPLPEPYRDGGDENG